MPDKGGGGLGHCLAFQVHVTELSLLPLMEIFGSGPTELACRGWILRLDTLRSISIWAETGVLELDPLQLMTGG